MYCGKKNEFPNLCKNKKINKNSLGLIHINIRSANKNFLLFEQELNLLQVNYSVIVLTETWLTSETKHIVQINGYKSFHIAEHGRGRGITVLIDERIQASIVESLSGSFEFYECLTLKVNIPSLGQVIISSFYRSPSLSTLSFNNILSDSFFAKLKRTDKLIIVGDFNINLFHENCRQTTSFIEIMRSHNLSPVITEATHVANNGIANSLIDHIWTNLTFSSHSFVHEVSITDHYPISIIFPEFTENKLVEIKFRDFSKENVDLFVSEMQVLAIQFNNYDEDSHTAMNNLLQWLQYLLNKYFPIRSKFISPRRSKSPWMTDRIISWIRKKHDIYQNIKDNKVTKEYFKKYKNTLGSAIKDAKNIYFMHKFTSLRNNIRKTWKLINDALGRSKISSINRLVINDEIIEDQNLICSKFNEFFCSAAENLKQNLATSIRDHIDSVPITENTAFFQPTVSEDIFKSIKSLKNSRNLEFPTKFLKLFSPSLSPILSKIINQCILNGVYPDCLKISRVVAIFKKGSKEDASNYRPISNLHDINKVFEKILYDRLINFFDRHNLLVKIQYGFMFGRNTLEACLDLIKLLLEPCTNSNKYALCIFIDFSKAFDCIDHDRLLQKLNRYGIRGNLNQLFKSYLSNRFQYVSCGNKNSEKLPITCGVPQGSILGPILFNIFINDIAYLQLNNVTPLLYADDTTYCSIGTDIFQMINDMEENLKTFSDWCLANKLILNAAKTKAMIITSKSTDNIPSININNAPIEYVNAFKYLGINIDNKLKFKDHIKQLNMRLSRISGTCYYMGPKFDTETALKYYYSMAYSIITYGIILWGGTSGYLIDSLQVSQNKIIRALFSNKFPNLHTHELYVKLGLLKISEIHKSELAKLIYTARNTEKYGDFSRLLQSLKFNNVIETRNSLKYRLPITRIEADHNGALCQSILTWNDEIPTSILTATSFPAFKTSLKKHFLSLYNNNQN